MNFLMSLLEGVTTKITARSLFSIVAMAIILTLTFSEYIFSSKSVPPRLTRLELQAQEHELSLAKQADAPQRISTLETTVQAHEVKLGKQEVLNTEISRRLTNIEDGVNLLVERELNKR